MRLRNIPGAKDAIESSPYVIHEPAQNKGRWNEIFKNNHPIHIEVGMGKGRFLMDLASQNPDINYIGIDIQKSVLSYALDKVLEVGVPNIKLLWVDGSELTNYFEDGEIDRLYLNFSDPWPKARHAKRRLTSREFLARYSQILPDGAVVEFKTDNKGLFEFSLEEVNESEGWELLAHTFDLHHQEDMMEGNVMTEYEEKFSSMGNPICKLIAVLHE